MKHNFNIKTLKALDELSQKILSLSKHYNIYIFKGDLGSGKTTLIQFLVKNLGSSDKVTSPTFSLIQAYESVNNQIYHFDLYRLKSVEELEEIGFFEYIYSGKKCFIEWPELIEPYLDMPYVSVNMTIQENNSRNITLDLFKNIS